MLNLKLTSVAIALIALAWTLRPNSAAAGSTPPPDPSNRVFIAATADYAGCPAGDIPNTIPEVIGFRDGMLASPGLPWTDGGFFADNIMWDSDFIDPERNSLGTDDWGFDVEGVGISFYAGHGVCGARPGEFGVPGPVQNCFVNANCNNPHAGATLPGFCQAHPGVARCSYRSPKVAVTCSTNDRFGGGAVYSGNTFARWGESADSGGWAGGGTNGGTNLIVMDTSCPVDPGHHVAQLQNAFAGLHLFATLIHFTGDTLDVVDRGPALAARASDNPTGSAAQAWLDTLLDVPVGIPGCAWGGGGRGLSGCGAHYVTSRDVTTADAAWHVDSETWTGLQSDGFDATGSGGFAWRALCNFDNCENLVWTM